MLAKHSVLQEQWSPDVALLVVLVLREGEGKASKMSRQALNKIHDKESFKDCVHLQSSQIGCTSAGPETEIRIFGKTADFASLIYSSSSPYCFYDSDFVYLV